MAKRFTDTDKWKRPWFSELSLQAKLTWIYLLDDCDHRGVWVANFKRASFDLGFKVDSEKLSEWFGQKLIPIENDKYYIPSFVEFQYKGELSETNKAHKPILAFLAKYSEKIASYKPLDRGMQAAQDKEQDKDKVKEPLGESEGISSEDLENLYRLYPRKDGKTAGMKKLKSEIKTQKDLEDFELAIAAFIRKHNALGTAPKFIPYFSTFVNHWRECLEPDYGTLSVSAPEVKSRDWLGTADRIWTLCLQNEFSLSERMRGLLGSDLVDVVKATGPLYDLRQQQKNDFTLKSFASRLKAAHESLSQKGA